MSTEKVQTKNDKFVCLVCDYNTCRKSQYDRHLTTSKHILSTKSSFFVPSNNCLDSTTNKCHDSTIKRLEQ